MKISENEGGKCSVPLSLDTHQCTDLGPAMERSGNDSDDFGSEEHEKSMKISENEGGKCSVPLSLDTHQCTDLGPAMERSGNESDDFGSEVLEGIRFSESSVDFKDIKSIENFTILVDGIVIDSEIPPHLRAKYYDLCRSQNAFLHDRLLEGLNCKLAAGIISETVNISDAIRASKLTTSRDSFTTWDETLKAFEKMGMNIGFLRARLARLVSFGFDSEKVLESKRLERVRAEEEMRTLISKILEMRVVMKNLDEEIKSLKSNSKSREVMFQEEAKAPW
ncbi:hypothetical protein U1Q18_003964 [Sarracenia purpurea var. burkii]